MHFKKFESKYYDFYRFSSLVKDLISNPRNISIPYDLEMQIIYKSYKRYNALKLNSILTPYDLHVEYIESDKKLLKDLIKYNEN